MAPPQTSLSGKELPPGQSEEKRQASTAPLPGESNEDAAACGCSRCLEDMFACFCFCVLLLAFACFHTFIMSRMAPRDPLECFGFCVSLGLGNKPCTEHLRTHRLNIVEKAAHSTEVVLLGSADLNRGGDAQSQRQGIQWTAQRTAKLVNKTRRQCQSTLSKLRNLKKSEELFRI